MSVSDLAQFTIGAASVLTAVIAFGSARRTAKEQAEFQRAINRPFLLPGNVKIENYEVGKSFAVKREVFCEGQTPALMVRAVSKCFIVRANEPDHLCTVDFPENAVDMVLVPKQRMQSTQMNQTMLTMADFADIANGQKLLISMLRVEYQDVARTTYHMSHLAKLIPGTGSFVTTKGGFSQS